MESEPVALIVEALAAGAAAGSHATATNAIKDAYAGLKALVKRRFASRPSGETALAEHENKPEAWRGALEAELLEVGAGDDVTVIAEARRLLFLIDAVRPSGARVTVRDSTQFQIGDRNVQFNRSEYGRGDEDQ